MGKETQKNSKTCGLRWEQFITWEKKLNKIIMIIRTQRKEQERKLKPKRNNGCTIQLLTTCWLPSPSWSSNRHLPDNSPHFIYWAWLSVVWNISLATLVRCPGGAPSQLLVHLLHRQSMEDWKSLDWRINIAQQQLKHQYVITILVKNPKQRTVPAPKKTCDYPSQTWDSLKEKSLFSTEEYKIILLSTSTNIKKFEVLTP